MNVKAEGAAARVAGPLDAAGLRDRVQDVIDDELTHQREVLAELGPDVEDLVTAIGRLLRGGKRLRAAFLYWGYRAAGRPDSHAAVRAATSMEFFQAAALIHDDVMDDSDTRRGMPAAHRAFASSHAERHWDGDAERFGLAGAILAGNLCLNWTEELYAGSGLPPAELGRGRTWFDRMRTQLMAGQFLDVVESMRPWHDLPAAERLQRAERVIHFKSAKYTIEHPLLIGAAAGGLAGADLERLSSYGLALGHAFQLRDDVLGVFGDPHETGKPAGDDLREGKRTVLVAHTLSRADALGTRLLEEHLGDVELDDAAIDRLRSVMTESGAVAAVEAEIEALATRALTELDALDLADPAHDVLRRLVTVATARSS